MKSFSVLLVFILAAIPVVAQTDTNVMVAPADTNAPATSTATNGGAAQTDTNTVVAPTNALATAPPAGLNAATRAMSLDDCIQETLQHNFDVQIGRTAPEISLFNLKSAYGGYDPTFNFSGQHQYNDTGPDFQNAIHIPGNSFEENAFNSGVNGSLPWGLAYNFSGNVSHTYNYHSALFTNTDNSGGQFGVSLTQPLLKNFWIDQTRLNIRVNKNRLKFSEQTLRSQFIVSINDVENAYYEFIYAQENVKVKQEALTLAQTQLDQDRQRMQIGTLAQLDVQQDEAAVAKSRADLIAALATLGTNERALKNLLTDQYSQWYDLRIQPTETLTAPLQSFDLQDSWSKGMNQRPDLIQARLNVEAQGIQLKFSHNQLFPELDLIGTYGFNGTGQQFNDTFNQFGEGSRPFYSYGAQLVMPLSNVGPRNQYKAGKVTMKQLLLQLKQLEQSVMVEIDNDIGTARSDYERVAASRQASFYAAAALDAEQKKYAVGKSTTFTVLQLQSTLTTDRGDEIRALADYNEAIASLGKAEGTTLERHNINIELK